MHEDPKMIEIARDSMILVVAQGHLLQPLTHRRYRLMHPATQLCLNRMQLCHHPLLCRFPPDDEGPIAPTLPTIMCETQEREGLGFSLPPLFPVSRGEPPELHQPPPPPTYFHTDLGHPLP